MPLFFIAGFDEHPGWSGQNCLDLLLVAVGLFTNLWADEALVTLTKPSTCAMRVTGGVAFCFTVGGQSGPMPAVSPFNQGVSGRRREGTVFLTVNSPAFPLFAWWVIAAAFARYSPGFARTVDWCGGVDGHVVPLD